MTRDEFVSMIQSGYSIKDETVTELERYLKKIDWKHYQTIYDEFIQTYSIASRPVLLSDVVKVVRKMGYNDKNNIFVYYQQCQKCRANYHMDVSGCPCCYEKTTIIIVKALEYPGNYIITRELCWRCDTYKKHMEKKDRTSPYGLVCNDYGVNPGTGKTCKKCECKECCVEEKQYRSNL